MFHRHVLAVSRLQVLVQDGKNLIVEDLEFADSVDHLLQRLMGRRKEKVSFNERSLVQWILGL